MSYIRTIIIFGVGQHFRERHYKVLENLHNTNQIRILAVVDLEKEASIVLSFFSDKTLIPENYIFLPEKQRNSIDIQNVNELISHKITISDLDAAIICTEPKAHKQYVLWAIKRGLDVFCDKPITAYPGIVSSSAVYQDYLEILEAQGNNAINFVLCTERRAHLGYNYIRDYLVSLLTEFGVPITYIGIHYADGLWNMPDEFFHRENHPYKYGYGVLFHSGYHYIDLLSGLLDLNKVITKSGNRHYDFRSYSTNAADLAKMLPDTVYQSLLETNKFSTYFEQSAMEEMKQFGETDLMITGQAFQEFGPMTNFDIKLFQSTVTKRHWHQLPKETYLGNGRLHQEHVTIYVGPLCSIHIQIHPYKLLTDNNDMVEDFSVTILNNEDLTKKSAVMLLTRQEFSKIYPKLNLNESMNIKARAWQLSEFISRRSGNSSLASHEASIKLFSLINSQLNNKKIQSTTHVEYV